MDTVKTRKVGNSLTVTIPKALDVPEGQEMVVYKGADNVIVLAPKIADPFAEAADLRMENDYVPEKQDIIWIDFDPSVGREIQKRRPAVVVSRKEYSERTGFVAVCPVTHGQKKLEKLGLLVPVLSSEVDGSVNPLQLYTFDFRERQAQKITTMDTPSFQKVVQLYNFIFEA